MAFVLTEKELLFHYGDTLAHYGVPGMKWGKTKLDAGKGARREAAGKRIDKAGGDKSKAIGKIAAVAIARTIGGAAGRNLVGNLSGNVAVANGITAIGRSANMALTIRDVNRIINIAKYQPE